MDSIQTNLGRFEDHSGTLWHWWSLLPKDALEALDYSIFKWEILANHPDLDDGGTATCGLCKLFLGPVDIDNKQMHCWGCPVSTFTGKTGCDGTPFMFYRSSDDDYEANDEEAAATALDEIKFLRKVREAWLGILEKS